jgi:hypothetical protein
VVECLRSKSKVLSSNSIKYCHIHNGVLFSHKEELNYIICREIGGMRLPYRNIACFHSYAESRPKFKIIIILLLLEKGYSW